MAHATHVKYSISNAMINTKQIKSVHECTITGSTLDIHTARNHEQSINMQADDYHGTVIEDSSDSFSPRLIYCSRMTTPPTAWITGHDFDESMFTQNVPMHVKGWSKLRHN